MNYTDEVRHTRVSIPQQTLRKRMKNDYNDMMWLNIFSADPKGEYIFLMIICAYSSRVYVNDELNVSLERPLVLIAY